MSCHTITGEVSTSRRTELMEFSIRELTPTGTKGPLLHVGHPTFLVNKWKVRA